MTRVLDWVRALAGGRRRVAGRPPGSAMVVVLRPATAVRRTAHGVVVERSGGGGVVVHRHEHHQHVARWRRATVGALTAARGAPGAPGLTTRTPDGATGARGATGEAGARGVVLALAGPPAAAIAGRAAADRVATSHRRVQRDAAPARAVAVASGVQEPRRVAPSAVVPRSALALAPTPSPSPAAMVLRTPAPASGTRKADANTATTEPPPGAPRGRTRDLTTPPSTSPTPASLLDDPAQLATLTDRIVAQIDRRMTAHRERLGQL